MTDGRVFHRTLFKFTAKKRKFPRELCEAFHENYPELALKKHKKSQQLNMKTGDMKKLMKISICNIHIMLPLFSINYLKLYK
jgi:hypothetical protein